MSPRMMKLLEPGEHYVILNIQMTCKYLLELEHNVLKSDNNFKSEFSAEWMMPAQSRTLKMSSYLLSV